jgi:hypothetical protein
VLTIPAAGLLGGAAYEISSRFGAHDAAGSLVITAAAAVGAFALFRLAQRNNVRPDDLDRTKVPREAQRIKVPREAGRIRVLPEADTETVGETRATALV